MTYQDLVNQAHAAKDGFASVTRNGHEYTLKITDVGSPAKYQRKDHYLDGKRVPVRDFQQMWEVSNA